MPTTNVTALERNATLVHRALRGLSPGWHSRAEIANVLNAARLHANHIAGLELLVARGQVIAEKHDAPQGPIERRWEYKLVTQERGL